MVENTLDTVWYSVLKYHLPAPYCIVHREGESLNGIACGTLGRSAVDCQRSNVVVPPSGIPCIQFDSCCAAISILGMITTPTNNSGIIITINHRQYLGAFLER
jgi:hypothetical protein